MKRGNNDLILFLLIIISVVILSGIAFVVGLGETEKGINLVVCEKPNNLDYMPVFNCDGIPSEGIIDTPEVRADISQWQCYHVAPAYSGYDPNQRCCRGSSIYLSNILTGVNLDLVDNDDELLSKLPPQENYYYLDLERRMQTYGLGNDCCNVKGPSDLAPTSLIPFTFYADYPEDNELCCEVNEFGGTGKVFNNPQYSGSCCYYHTRQKEVNKGASSPIGDVQKVEMINTDSQRCCENVGPIKKPIYTDGENEYDTPISGQLCCSNVADEYAQAGSQVLCNIETYFETADDGQKTPISTTCCKVYDKSNTGEYTIKCLDSKRCSEVNQWRHN